MLSLQLHRQLVQQFDQLGLKASATQRQNLALVCQALAFSPNCHLAALALDLPLTGKRENVIQRLRRTLKDEQLTPARCYEPLPPQLLAQWSNQELALVMDRTDIENRWSVLTVGLAYRKRLVPLAWEVQPFGGTSGDDPCALLQRIQPALAAAAVRVCFLADSEFRAVPLQRYCQQQGWHWQVGLKSDVLFCSALGEWQALRTLNLQRGERRYRNGIYLTREHQFGPLNLLADWSPQQEQPRYWALDLPADRHAWRRGRKRYWIEPTFRDWKSYGFDLERSQINESHSLDVLLLGIALTTVWLIHVGDELIRSGRASELEPDAQTDYSVFRLGRDYLHRCRTLQRPVPIGFTLMR